MSEKPIKNKKRCQINWILSVLSVKSLMISSLFVCLVLYQVANRAREASKHSVCSLIWLLYDNLNLRSAQTDWRPAWCLPLHQHIPQPSSQNRTCCLILFVLWSRFLFECGRVTFHERNIRMCQYSLEINGGRKKMSRCNDPTPQLYNVWYQEP